MRELKTKTPDRAIAFLLLAGLWAYAQAPAWPSSALDASGAWWQRVHVVAMDDAPGLDDLITVFGWGGTVETEAQFQHAKRAVVTAHASGKRYVAQISTLDAAWETYAERPDLVTAAVIDIDGKPLIVQWESAPGKPLLWGNTNLPVWRDFIMGQARRAVDAGVDAIMIDEGQGTAGSLAYGGSFGPTDMALFRAYLAKRYTAGQLSALYGIADLSSFDYGNYIRSRGLAVTWKTEPHRVPLYRDFYEFQTQAALEFLTLLINTTREYARARYGRHIAFSTNTFGFWSSFLPMTPLLDYFTIEYPFQLYGYAPLDSPIPELRLAAALGNRAAWLLPSVNTVAEWEGRSVDTLYQIYTAQCYAAHGALFAPYGIYGYSASLGGVFLKRDTSKLRPAYSTVTAYSSFLEKRASLATVALLYSQASEDYRGDRHRASYRGTAHALLNGHIQYDVVPLGNSAGVPESPGAEGLRGYSAAFLPYGACLSDSQINDLLSWVRQGGRLIVFGELGACNLTGQPTTFPNLAPFKTIGVRSYGSGQVVTEEDLGAAYRAVRSPANLARVTQLLSAAPEQPVTTNAPADVNVLAETALSGEVLLVHLINAGWEASTDSTRRSGAFSVKVALPVPLRSTSLDFHGSPFA